jgi:alpha-beta hydrolase superfamily lysophospholipase
MKILQMDRKIIFRWVKLFLLAYGVIGIVVYYIQDKLILHPTTLPAGEPYRFSQPAAELNLNYDIETNLNVVEFKATGRPADSVSQGPDTLAPGANGLEKGVVLFFHDSRGNIGDYAGVSPGITSHGYELWMMDYPGFGKSTGPMDEKRLYDLALVFYKLARSRWKPGQIVIEGQGFGTGVAAQLAAVRDCRRLVLERPYYSMTSVFRRYLFLYPVGGRFLHYHLPVNEDLQKVTAPVTIIQGDAGLKTFLKPGDEFLDTWDFNL